MSESGQRIFPRADGEYVAWYQLAEAGFLRCVALDIGVDGARLRVAGPLSEGQPLEVSFELTSDWLVRTRAQIVWQRQESDGYYVGIRFRPVRSADRTLLGPWVHRQKRQSKS